MNLIKLPDGTVVNLSNVVDMEVSGSNITYTYIGTATRVYAAASNAEALALLDQSIEAAQADSASPRELVTVPATRSITSFTPNSVVGTAYTSVTIAGVNMIDQVMIDRGELIVKVNGTIAGISSSSPTSIVMVVPAVSPGLATVNIYQSIYATGTLNLLCSDTTNLTIT